MVLSRPEHNHLERLKTRATGVQPVLDPWLGLRRSAPLLNAVRRVLFTTCIVAFCAIGSEVNAQQSDNPSDATPSLAYTLNAADQIVVCTNGSETLGGTLSGATNTPTSILPAALCGSFTASTSDVWYRLDMPAGADNRFRFTVKDGASNPLTNGAMAAYIAPSAAGPFELVDCAVGGNLTNSGTNPTLEVNCAPPGSRIYIRIWEEGVAVSTKNFTLCVQGQDWTNTATRKDVADTPCGVYATPTPPTILTVGAALATYYNTFACTENFPYDPSCGGYRTGDVWFRAVVPASGMLRVAAAWGLTSSRRVSRMGFAIYTAGGTCSDYTQFNEVACGTGTLTATETTYATASCLTPGSTVYVRAYAHYIDAQSFPSRYGAFRLRVTDPLGTAGTATNNLPCGATALTFGSCSGAYTAWPSGINVNACSTPGVPAPGCGSLSSSTPDVWYRFVGPANGTVEIRVQGNASVVPAFDPAMALYTTDGGTCSGPMTLIECDENHGVGLGAYIVRNGLTPGETYYLRIWGQGTSGTQTGIFYVCINTPTPSAGHCFYVLSMSYDGTGGTQTMQRIIGTDTVSYTTAGEPNQVFLIELPAGTPVTFYWNESLKTLSGGIWYSFSGAQLGQVPRWRDTAGGPVLGPAVPPQPLHSVVACEPYAAVEEDCLGATTICGPTTLNDTTLLDNPSNYNGYSPDLTNTNRGCLSVEQLGGRWFVFRAQASGTVSLSLVGTTFPTDDLDFAIWDAGLQPTTNLPYVTPSVCSPTGPPVRCSSARLPGPTGLRANIPNRFSEGTGGFGWLSPLNVVQDHVYLLYVVNNNITIPGPPFPNPNATISIRKFSIVWSQLLNTVGATDNTILGCDRIILPVELLSFDAERATEEVHVSWSTGSEKESSYFGIERCTDGASFAEIGRVEAMGTSMMRQDYHFVDPEPEQGVNYYRLRMVDTDGSFEYSDIDVVIMGSPTRMTLFPNPANDQLHITLEKAMDGPVMVEVFDATGRAVLQRTLNVSDAFQTHINVADLAQGSYMLRLSSGAGNATSARFMKR